MELCVNNAWGTVCEDDIFGPLDAGVICYQMGGFFRDMADVLEGGEPGAGPIFLEQVSCVGSEDRLLDCVSHSLGLHSCNHDNDAHIRCRGKQCRKKYCEHGVAIRADCI